MCFPRLSKSFCCCSLRTGFILVCWLGLIWSGIEFLHPGKPKPWILSFFSDEFKKSGITADKLDVAGQLYYATQIVIYCFAILGTQWNRSGCLNLLIFSETIILLLYFLMTLITVSQSIANHSTALDERSISMAFLLGLKYYVYLIIISFYYEVMHGRDGRGQGGVIISQRNLIFSPSAPNANDLTSHPAQFVDTPYPVQTVILETQPHPVQNCSISSIPQNSYAPPPYPTISEKPPPYTP